MYILPVTLLSFALNIPKFMEVTLTQVGGKGHKRINTEILQLVVFDVYKSGAVPALVDTGSNSQQK